MRRRGFGGRVFADQELADCRRRARPQIHLAARFAVKEAYFKALGTGWSGVAWKEVVVRSDGASPPTVLTSGTVSELSRSRGVKKVHLSISHEGDYAVAVVVLEGNPPRRGATRRPAR